MYAGTAFMDSGSGYTRAGVKAKGFFQGPEKARVRSGRSLFPADAVPEMDEK